MMKSIADCTAILPHVIADSVINELDVYLTRRGDSLPQDRLVLADKLAARAEAHWQANEGHRKKVLRNNTFGRDWLYTFMRHWLAAELLPLYHAGKIPQSFANGEAIV